MEHRWGRRRTADVAVKIVTLPSINGTGRLINISATGAFLETRTPLRLLSVIYIQLEEQDAVGHIAASVVRRTENGVGLEWCEFGAEATEVYLRITRSSEDLSSTQQLALLERGAPEPVYAARARAAGHAAGAQSDGAHADGTHPRDTGTHALERLGLCKVRFVTGDSRGAAR